MDAAALGLSSQKTHSALAALAVDDVQAETVPHDAIQQVEASVINAVASLTRLSESVATDIAPARLSLRDTAREVDSVWHGNLPALAELPGVSPVARIPWNSPPRSTQGFLKMQGLDDLV